MRDCWLRLCNLKLCIGTLLHVFLRAKVAVNCERRFPGGGGATNSIVDEEGWLHTGDIVMLDRLKDTIQGISDRHKGCYYWNAGARTLVISSSRNSGSKSKIL
ncbi:hypothetical protein C5167_021480 [Papaver somniferum]|nr:hypothetical protein C5167_021480 [Papaver somniferum]